jgi:hypothetical protein
MSKRWLDIEQGERDWWDRIGEMGWQHIVLIVLAVAVFVALLFAPAATCSFKSTDTPTQHSEGGTDA